MRVASRSRTGHRAFPGVGGLFGLELEFDRMKIPPRPDPSFEEDYDDGDPFACIAAGAAGVRSKMDALKAEAKACFGQPQEMLEALIAADRKNALAALWEVWYQDRFLARPGKSGRAEWAAEQSARLGNASLLEYDRWKSAAP